MTKKKSAQAHKLHFDQFYNEYLKMKVKAQRLNARYDTAMIIIGVRIIKSK